MAVQSAQVSAKSRTELGSRANKRLRDAGFVPGVIYGHKEAVIPVTLQKKELTGHLGRGAHLFDVALDGTSQKVLIKEVQFDHLGMEVIHVDFARVSLDEKVELTIPLELKGTPKGEEDGGVLQQVVMELEIECLVTDIPDAIRHNVSDMGMDSVLHIKDIKLPPGVKALQDEDLIVATVREIAEEEVAAPTEAESAEPELIGRKPDAEEPAEGAEAAAKPAEKKVEKK
jgi:large subunit ribosomal protein L25